MRDSKLIKLFKLLDKEELRRFKKQLQSPFFTTNKHLLKIYEYLIKDYPTFTSPRLNKAIVFENIFPNRAYNDNKLRMLLRAFTRQLEDFLIIKEVRENDAIRQRKLIDVYGKRSQMDLFEKGTYQLLEEMEKMPIKSNSHFFEQQQLIQQLVYHPATPKLKEMNHLQTRMMEHLDIHYWVNKIWLSCNLLSMDKFLKLEYTIKDIEVAIGKLPEKYFQKHPPLDTFVKAFMFLKLPSNTAFFELKNTYKKNITKLSLSNKRDLLTYLINYSILKWNQGEEFFLKENFELTKLGLGHDLLIESGRLNNSLFINTCLVAIRSNEYHWVEQFIEDYQDKLDKNQRNDTITLCRAYLFFYKKNYNNLIDLLLNYRFKFFKDNLRSKALLFRSYYKLFLADKSYLEVFISYSFSFEKFLRRDDISTKDIPKSYLNFIVTLRKIVKLINEKKWNKKWSDKFEKRINQEKTALKQWLEEELEKLKTLNYKQ